MFALHLIAAAVAVVLAAKPSAGERVGEYLQASFRVQQSLQGRAAFTRVVMPASDVGIHVRVAADTVEEVKRTQKLIKSRGAAFQPMERTVIGKVVIAEKRIEVWLGGGGYHGSGEEMVPANRPCPEPEYKVRWVSDASGNVRPEIQRDDAAALRNEETQRAAERSADLAREARIRDAARRAGSRIVFEFREAIPPERITTGNVLKLLAPYVIVPGVEAEPAI